MQLTITLSIIIITCLISIGGLNSRNTMADLLFYPAAMRNGRQLYRFVTHGLVHADLFHLIFNMFTLYFFGGLIESAFTAWTGNKLVYLIFYITALAVASIPDYFKHKNQPEYRSLGASGAVSAILFSFILLAPWQSIMVWFIPMPAIVFAVLYTIYSIYMDRKGGDNINHGAHLWGAAYGVLFTIIIKPEVIQNFINQVTHPSF